MKNLFAKLSTGALLCYSRAYAALPKAAESESAANGDYIGMGKEFSQSGVSLIVQIFGAGILIAVAVALVKTFWEIHKGKKEWSDLTGVGVGGLAIAVVGIVLLTQAETILQ